MAWFSGIKHRWNRAKVFLTERCMIFLPQVFLSFSPSLFSSLSLTWLTSMDTPLAAHLLCRCLLQPYSLFLLLSFLPSQSLSLDKPHQLKCSPLLSALSHRSAHPPYFPPSLPWFSCFSRLHPLSQNSSLSLFFPFDRSPPGKVLSAKNNLQPTCYMSPLHRISLLLPKNHHYSHTLSWQLTLSNWLLEASSRWQKRGDRKEVCPLDPKWGSTTSKSILQV